METYEKQTEGNENKHEKETMSGDVLQNPHKIRSLAQIPASLGTILSLTCVQVIITEVMRKRWWRVWKKVVLVFLSYTSSTAIWIVYPQLFSLFVCVNAHKKIDLWLWRKLQESKHGGRHVSEQLPSLQRTSRHTSMEYYTAATSHKVKKTNTAAWGYLHKRLAPM